MTETTRSTSQLLWCPDSNCFYTVEEIRLSPQRLAEHLAKDHPERLSQKPDERILLERREPNHSDPQPSRCGVPWDQHPTANGEPYCEASSCPATRYSDQEAR